MYIPQIKTSVFDIRPLKTTNVIRQTKQ